VADYQRQNNGFTTIARLKQLTDFHM